MRIGLIAHLKHPVAEPFAGGLEMHTALLARKLRDRGHDVTLFASTKSDVSLGVEPICEETSLKAVGTAEAWDIAFFKEHHAYLCLMARLRAGNFDVVHNNSLHYLPVAMAGTLSIPMVTSLHTPPFSWLESGIRACSERRSRFVAVSNFVREAWGHVAPIDQVVMNGIQLDRFAFRAHADTPRYLFWHGRIVPEKGLHLAIQAARQTGIDLHFAGPISDEDYYRERIAPLLGEGVHHLGHLPHGALSTALAGATALVCSPAWEEPYGLVVAEALACGVPVAAFRRGAIPEIVTHHCGVLATPDDPAALARGILSAIKLERVACRRRAEEFCSAEVMIDAYEETYRDAIDHFAVKLRVATSSQAMSVSSRIRRRDVRPRLDTTENLRRRSIVGFDSMVTMSKAIE